MKRIILSLGFLALTFSPCLAQQTPWGMQDGQTVKQYDKYGSYQGYYRQNGDSTKQYDRYGSYQGYYKK